MTGDLARGARLEDLSREELLSKVRELLVEADALSTRITVVNEISVAINHTLDIEEILRVVGRQTKWLLDFEHLSVYVVESPENSRLVTLFGPPLQGDYLTFMTKSVAEAVQTKRPLLIRKRAPEQPESSFESQMIFPLASESEILGTINFATTQPNAYNQDDMRIGYMLAHQLAAAVRNVNQFNALKQARETLQGYTKDLEERNRELDAFSHTIAHDLKAPLSLIVMRADLLLQHLIRDNAMPVSAPASLEGIKKAGFRMTGMIDQLLWLAKLRDVSKALVAVEVAPVVTAALARFQDVIEERKIQIEIAEYPDVLGQAQWIEEVFANLISNAIKYMGSDNASPSITIRSVQQEKAVRFEVQDTGVGIAPEDQKRLFEMFTRLHTVEAEGLGLGLSIVHRMVTKLGGTVGVESELGKGSTFWFTLPTPAE